MNNYLLRIPATNMNYRHSYTLQPLVYSLFFTYVWFASFAFNIQYFNCQSIFHNQNIENSLISYIILINNKISTNGRRVTRPTSDHPCFIRLYKNAHKRSLCNICSNKKLKRYHERFICNCQSRRCTTFLFRRRSFSANTHPAFIYDTQL